MGQLVKRRGNVTNTETKGGLFILNADVPLSTILEIIFVRIEDHFPILSPKKRGVWWTRQPTRSNCWACGGPGNQHAQTVGRVVDQATNTLKLLGI
jgi:hypothetical protein